MPDVTPQLNVTISVHLPDGEVLTLDAAKPGASFMLEVLALGLPYAPASERGVPMTDDPQSHVRHFLQGLSKALRLYRGGAEQRAYEEHAKLMREHAQKLFREFVEKALARAEEPLPEDAPFQTFAERFREIFREVIEGGDDPAWNELFALLKLQWVDVSDLEQVFPKEPEAHV